MTQQVQDIPTTTSGPTRSRRFDPTVVAWCVAAAALLVGAGSYRGVQASRLASGAEHEAVCPFPLIEIPKVIGDWRVVEGSETMLDSQTTRITGSTDHIIRNYCDEMTGVTLSVLILYGPAGPVTPHTPQVCYPASGFAPVGPTVDRQVPFGSGEVADFRSSIFAKSGGRATIMQTVYHSYELDGAWSPTIDPGKLRRRNPGVFKVQIQRRFSEHETRGENEPIEAFVTKLIPVLEKMIDEHKTKPAAQSAQAATATPGHG